MKANHIIRFIGYQVLISLAGCFFICGTFPAKAQTGEQITIHCEQGLEPLLHQWTSEYSRINAAVTINVVTYAGENVLSEGLVFGKSTGRYNAGTAAWEVAVGKDVIVVLMGDQLIAKDILLKNGIRNSLLAEMMVNPAKRQWNVIQDGLAGNIRITGCGDKEMLHPFTRFSGATKVPDIETWYNNPEELVMRLRQDNQALGICRLDELLSKNQGKLPDGIRLVPVDKNNNSRLDPFEKIFDSPSGLIRGAWAGKYPSYLCSDLVFLSGSRPEDKTAQLFISWILWEGQDILANNGFCELTQNEKEVCTRQLTGVVPVLASKESPAGMALWLIVLLILIAAGLVAGFIVFAGKRHTQNDSDPHNVHGKKLEEGKLSCPKGYFFDKTHTWVYLEEEGAVKTGIDDFLQHLTGTLSRVAMLEPGTKIRKGERILTLISQGKQLTIYSPVTGTIMEKNAMIDGDSSLLNSAPYHEGWIYRIEPSNWKRELGFLMVGATYTDWIRNELIRLRDFFSMSLTVKQAGLQTIVIQDGGDITDHVLAGLGPEVWEDFQCHFIDPSR